MKLCENLHQIKINFHVTPEIERYVYVYLLTGEKCYLIDSGVAGAETILEDYIAGLGRALGDIAGVFLTHATPTTSAGLPNSRHAPAVKSTPARESGPGFKTSISSTRNGPSPTFSPW